MSLGLSKNQATLRANRRTVPQLLAAAAKDTDAASVFYAGADETDTDSAIIVIKGREHMNYVVDMLIRQKLLTPRKDIESDGSVLDGTNRTTSGAIGQP